MKKYEILLVDDDIFILKTIQLSLEDRGYNVKTANNGEKALEIFNQHHFDLVITDLVMEPLDGIGVLKKVKEINSDTMVIIITGYGDIHSAIDALRLRADDYLLKPCEEEEIYFKVSSLLEKLELKKKIKFYESILPVCSLCKSVRDDTGKKPGTGEWMSPENYLWKKAGIKPSHTYCIECAKKVMDELDREYPE